MVAWLLVFWEHAGLVFCPQLPYVSEWRIMMLFVRRCADYGVHIRLFPRRGAAFISQDHSHCLSTRWRTHDFLGLT